MSSLHESRLQNLIHKPTNTYRTTSLHMRVMVRKRSTPNPLRVDNYERKKRDLLTMQTIRLLSRYTLYTLYNFAVIKKSQYRVYGAHRNVSTEGCGADRFTPISGNKYLLDNAGYVHAVSYVKIKCMIVAIDCNMAKPFHAATLGFDQKERIKFEHDHQSKVVAKCPGK